jgi:hypothetical protein
MAEKKQRYGIRLEHESRNGVVALPTQIAVTACTIPLLLGAALIVAFRLSACSP